jgi:hypothetical protein
MVHLHSIWGLPDHLIIPLALFTCFHRALFLLVIRPLEYFTLPFEWMRLTYVKYKLGGRIK